MTEENLTTTTLTVGKKTTHRTTTGVVRVRLTLPASWADASSSTRRSAPPPGGVVLRVRVPVKRADIVRVQLMGGGQPKPWHSFNGSDIMFDRATLASREALQELSEVHVAFA